MTPAEKLQLKNAVLRILHGPGGPLAGHGGSGPAVNDRVRGERQDRIKPGAVTPGSGTFLEMTFVFDGSLSIEAARTIGTEVMTVLKGTDEIFRNVRCNVVRWLSDERIIHEVTAAMMIQTGRCFAGWTQQPETKRLEVLLADLKKFEARSRLLIVAAAPGYVVRDDKLKKESLNPFLYRRLLLLQKGGMQEGHRLLLS